MNKKRINSYIFLILLLGVVLSPLIAEESDLDRQLKSGFMHALSTPEGFRSTEIFKLLGYLDPEISLIGKITPRPAFVQVEYQPASFAYEFSNIKVICSQVGYYNLTIATATFEFPNCQLDMMQLQQNRIRFLKSDEIKLKTEVSENDILKVFELYTQAKALRDLSLDLGKERANLGGWFRKGVLTVSFKVTGRVELVNPKVVNFNCDKLTMNKIVLPRNAARAVFAKINPVFDSRKTWLNLNIDSVSIKNGFVETNARISRREG
ncbi:MAG: hypothetical protein AB1403_09745 [Candidatus Riflebacteria bacterium]